MNVDVDEHAGCNGFTLSGRPGRHKPCFREKLPLMTVRLFLGFIGLVSLSCAADPALIRPKVVVVTMFEPGGPGAPPGELRFWVEREPLARTIPLPTALHDLRANADNSVVALLTGVGNTNAAAAIMALGLDPRFDLRQSYWVVAGIAGIDPADATLGSAVWADYVVDGSLAHEVDAREMPADWPTGYFPLDRSRPYEMPRAAVDFETGNVFQLDAGFVRWAYELTRDTELPDTEKMRRRRAKYPGMPNAQRAPFVLVGANLASPTYWTGRLMNQWANAWTRYYTDGKANYVTTAMEDTGTLRALTNLGRAGKVDARRVLALRTASDFDMPWPGATAMEAFNGGGDGQYPAYLPALEAAYRVGSRVVHALVADWEHCATTVPGADRK